MTNDDGSYNAYIARQAATAKPRSAAGITRFSGRDTFSSFYRSERVPQELPPRSPRFVITSRQKVAGGEMVGWRLTYLDFSGGYAQDVDLSDGGGANMASGTWDVRKRGMMTQPLQTTQQPVTGVQQFMMTHSQWEGRLVLLIGGAASKTMWFETSENNPALLSTVFSPGANEMPLWHGPLTFGATTYWVEAHIGTAPGVYDSPGGTLLGAMDPNLAGCAGWMEMPVNVSPGSALKLFVTLTGDIFAMESSMAYNALPKLVSSQADRGKLPYWLHPLDVVPWGRGLRAFWKSPAYSPIGSAAGIYNPATMFHPRELNATGLDRRIRLPHCDVTGLDWDEAKIDELPYLTNATVWRNGLVATDDTSIVWKTGNGQYRRVYLNEQMPALTNRQRVIVDFGDRGRDLLIRIDEIAINGATTPTTTYDVALNGNTWGLSPASEVVTLTGTGRKSLAGVGRGGGMPIGLSTGYAHAMAEGNFYRYAAPMGGQSGWDLRNSVHNFGAPVSGNLPDTILPEPFCYLASTPDAVLLKGYLPDGHHLTVDWGKSHEDGSVAATGAVATFDGPLNRASHRYTHQGNQGRFTDILEASISLTRDPGDETPTDTARILHLAFEGHCLVPDAIDFNDYVRYFDD